MTIYHIDGYAIEVTTEAQPNVKIGDSWFGEHTEITISTEYEGVVYCMKYPWGKTTPHSVVSASVVPERLSKTSSGIEVECRMEVLVQNYYFSTSSGPETKTHQGKTSFFLKPTV